MKTADATGLRRSLDSAIEAGTVKRSGLCFVPTRSGRRAMARSGMERLYGVEADPPEMPGKLQGPIDPGVEVITPLHHTTYEMRPEGITLDVNPQLGPDRRTIDLSIAPERVSRLGDAGLWAAAVENDAAPVPRRAPGDKRHPSGGALRSAGGAFHPVPGRPEHGPLHMVFVTSSLKGGG